jgi:two-component system phosphate regulon response regulator OmpR
MEFDLLAAFARNPNRMLSRKTSLDLAHSHEFEPFDRCVDRVRRKAERDPEKPQVIQPIRGAAAMCVPSKP